MRVIIDIPREDALTAAMTLTKDTGMKREIEKAIDHCQREDTVLNLEGTEESGSLFIALAIQALAQRMGIL